MSTDVLLLRNNVVFVSIALFSVKILKQMRACPGQSASFHLSVIVGVKCQDYITHNPPQLPMKMRMYLSLNIQSLRPSVCTLMI